MKLLLRRDQKAGMLGMGKIAFILDVRAEISEEEKMHIKKYRLGDTLLYSKNLMTDPGRGILGYLWRIFFRMRNFSISVNDLSGGKQVQCKDVVEMIEIEEEVKKACHTFRAVLHAAATFGGEEVIEIA